MKVLLIHPGDIAPRAKGPWDLVVDLGRGAGSTYQEWAGDVGCPVVSIYDFAERGNELRRIRSFLQIGAGVLTDKFGIDWWDVLSPYLVPQLYLLLLIHRLAKYIGGECDLYGSRADYRITSLHAQLGGSLTILESAMHARVRKVQHYRQVISKLSARQVFQIAQDKFDSDHRVRRHFVGKPKGSRSQSLSILAPSAYVNVSRTVISCARGIPDEQFLLVCARNDARVSELPPNVRMIPLDPFFPRADTAEVKILLASWIALKRHLIASAPEFESADLSGSLNVIPSMFQWVTTVRNAWLALFQSEKISSCFCADQNNPSTRIPLLLANYFGYPTVACHHGALDASMATKNQHPDFYLAKGEMEYDYMIRVCGLPREKVITQTPSLDEPSSTSYSAAGKSLVFFTEPYALGDWRTEDIYREMLPQLLSLADSCGLRLVFKLHPFETRKAHLALLRRHLPIDKTRQIDVITGPISDSLWGEIRFAVTAQSTVAVECAARGIPIFVCGWLVESFVGYSQQFGKFGAGYILESAAQLVDIPHIAASRFAQFRAKPGLMNPISPQTLRELIADRPRIPADALLG